MGWEVAMEGVERVVPLRVVVGTAGLTVVTVVARVWVNDASGFGWEALAVVMDALVDIGLGVVIAALVIDRVSTRLAKRSLARLGWGGFRLLAISITDTLAELCAALVRHYSAASEDKTVQPVITEIRRDVSGPPTQEGGARLMRAKDVLDKVSEIYRDKMKSMVGAEHQPAEGSNFIARFEKSDSSWTRLDPWLQNIDEAAWRLAEVWTPEHRSLLLEAELEFQRSARKWRSLMDGGPDAQISPEFSLVDHGLGTVRAAVDVMDRAINMYVTLLVLTEDIRRTGMEPGSTLDQLERLRDDVDKLMVRGDAPPA